MKNSNNSRTITIGIGVKCPESSERLADKFSFFSPLNIIKF